MFRRAAGAVYVALDYGESGGGHGHPDRLNLLWASGRSRLLDDLGTGSYVDQSLHWYRSTLAHNAPLFNGRSQFRANGTLRAWDERGGVGWVLAEADGLAPGVRVQRALIVTPDYFVDEIRWTADHQSRFELPIHFGGEFMSPGVSLGREAGASLDGGQGVEDGFSCTRDVLTASLAPKAVVTLRQFAESAEPPEMGQFGAGRMWVCTESASRWYRALAPGQPATTLHPFFVVRCEGTEGVVRTVGAWSPRVTDAGFSEDHIVIALGAERHEHYQTPEHWQVELTVGGAKSGIELTGWKARAAMREGERPADSLGAASRARAPLQLRRGVETQFDLGEAHYRRSEETWREAGRPSARVTLRATATELVVDVDAMAKPPMFVARDTVNPYDNEHPDINGHGVQLYVRTASDGGGWIIVPEPDHLTARSRSLEGWGGLALRRSEWSRTPHGYLMRAVIDLPAAARGGEYPISVDVLVNETVPGRERRRGQLVLSGGAGEFVYLRGDRHDPDRLMDMLLVD